MSERSGRSRIRSRETALRDVWHKGALADIVEIYYQHGREWSMSTRVDRQRGIEGILAWLT
jgi:hypothetical protein